MTSTTSLSAEQSAQLLYPPNVAYNATHLSTIKFLSACFGGAVAGILGLENFIGFGLFVGTMLLTAMCVWLFKCKGKVMGKSGVGKYVQGGLWEVVNPGQENTFSFLLAWTLFYGIVHVYD